MITVEIMATASIIIIGKYSKKTEPTMLIAGTSVIIPIYAGVSLLISLIFATGLFDSIKALVTIQLLFLAIAAIIVILLLLFAKSSSEKDKSALQSAAQIKQTQDDLFILMNDDRNSAYKKKLEKLYEAVRYCDNGTYAPSDDKIAVKVIELENALLDDSEDKDSKVDGLINELLLLNKKRTLEVQNKKRGGI